MATTKVIGVTVHKPTTRVFQALAIRGIPVDLVKSVSLLPPVHQALRYFVLQNGRIPTPVQQKVLFARLNEGGKYKLWNFRMFRCFAEFHCFTNPATRTQWYKVLTITQRLMDRERVCLAGAPSSTGLTCRGAVAPFITIERCADLRVNGYLDGHILLVTLYIIHVAETMVYMITFGRFEEVMTARGLESVLIAPDVISNEHEVTLTGPSGEGKGCYLNLLTGRHDRNVNTSQTKVKTLLTECGFKFQVDPRTGTIEVDLDINVVPHLRASIDKFRLMAHGYALATYSNDHQASARYTLQDYIDTCGMVDVRTKVLKDQMFPHAFNEHVLRSRIGE